MNNKDLIELRELINKNITAIRKSKKIKPSELARKIGWSRQQFYDFEKSKRMFRLSTLVRIAKGLDVNIVDLFEDYQKEKIEPELKIKLKLLDRKQQKFVEKVVDALIELEDRES